MTSATLKKYLLGFLGGALFIWSLARIISFSVAHWGQPWPHPLLAIDGNSYIAGAERSITGAGLFPLQDIYHSPGYQYILGFLFWIGGSKEAGIAWSKSLNLALFAGSLILTFRLTRRFFDKGVAMLATLLFFCSLSWLYYCHMIQYEVVMGFLLLAWLSLESRSRCDSPKKEILVSFFSGALLFLLILIHSRLVFLAIVPLSRAWDHWRKKEMLLLRNVLLSLGAALVPIVAWSVYYSRQLGHLIWIMERRDLLFRLGNNPNALGVGYPYPPIGEPSGWAFVFSKPGRELWLIGQRFLYIWGIKPDVWAIPPPFQNRTATETLFHTAACTLFFLGLYFSLTLPRGRESSDRRWIYLVLLAVLAPPMAMYGDQRFLIPVIPYVVMFQALALCTVYRRLAK